MKFPLKKNQALLIGILLFCLLFLNFYRNQAKNFLYSVFSPFQKVFWRTGQDFSDFIFLFLEIKKQQKENDFLKLKNQELLSQQIRFKETEKENEALRKALGIELQKDFELAFSNVISKDIFEDLILIDKGFQQGISEGLPVITEQRVLLGRVSQVFQDFSKVSLISHKKSNFSAKIQDKEIQGMVKGEGNFNLSFELVLKTEQIEQGDILVTSQLGGIFPQGLLVGQIEKVEKRDIEPFQKAKINPFFEIEKIEKVFLIKEW